MIKYLYFIFISLLLFSCGTSDTELVEIARKKLDEQDYEKALEYADKAIEKNAKNPVAYNVKGVALFELKKFGEALKAYTESINCDSNNYRPFYNRGKVENVLGQNKEAL